MTVASGTFLLGGDLPVVRLGYGSMQLTGYGVWGAPDDPAEAVRVLRRAVELGVNFVDTADSYGPAVAEGLVREALHPYDAVFVATKAGAAPVSVQNLYNVADRRAEESLEFCEARGIGFVPWFLLAAGGLAKEHGPLALMAERHSASPSQLALAWLLRRSPVMVPIPGTSSVAHLEENVAAADIELTDEEFEAIAKAT